MPGTLYALDLLLFKVVVIGSLAENGKKRGLEANTDTCKVSDGIRKESKVGVEASMNGRELEHISKFTSTCIL